MLNILLPSRLKLAKAGAIAASIIVATAICYVASKGFPAKANKHQKGDSRSSDDSGNMDEAEAGSDETDSDEDHYFAAYGSNIEITRQMLMDETRTSAYARAIAALPMIRGAVVLDVGAGTGLLSIFAALAGARRVYAVEGSSMAATAAEVVKKNGVEDIVTVLHCKVDDLELPEKVDLIISEWMGMLLFFESMWESVLVARDRWPKPDGIVLPSIIKLYAAPVDISDHWNEKIGTWRSIWGLDMSSMENLAKEAYYVHPVFDVCVKSSELLANGELLLEFDMNDVKICDIDNFSHTWTAKTRRRGTLHGICSWFVCSFDVSSSIECGHGAASFEDEGYQRLSAIIEALETSISRRLEQTLPSEISTYDYGLERSWASSWWILQGESDESKNGTEGSRKGYDYHGNAKYISLDTSPCSPLTHWGHPILVFDNAHPVNMDEELRLCFIMQRNMDSKRHYHFTIEAMPTAMQNRWKELKWFPLWK